MSQPKYQFASSAPYHGGGKKSGSRHRRSYSEDTDTDGASLTYSATSSVHSGGSAAGESTDSSFADIMRVLDLQDSEQLKEIIKKEGVSSIDELQRKRGYHSGAGSVASSLAYSTDGDSHLEGTKLLQTIAGQPSDSYAFDGGGAGDENLDLLFAPAAPAVVKRSKGNKVVLGKDKNAQGVNTTPKSKTVRKAFEGENAESPSSNKSTPTKAPPSSSPGTPPLPRKNRNAGSIQVEEEDVDYKEWWMQCFPDAFKNLMPTR
ncbi:hypothetical protein IV203_030878 [Nitzschia inconspicua]|uniref:Uncharacterized protein n=1 Tax=Nitzschia inconspicua TaxID=303405 RepID=A0A9K3LTA2_9STRA|nr:hypothetical protein IV203_030878 [Nitzschia inconspicua]